jgi:hypothetical protein
MDNTNSQCGFPLYMYIIFNLLRSFLNIKLPTHSTIRLIISIRGVCAKRKRKKEKKIYTESRSCLETVGEKGVKRKKNLYGVKILLGHRG